MAEELPTQGDWRHLMELNFQDAVDAEVAGDHRLASAWMSQALLCEHEAARAKFAIAGGWRTQDTNTCG